MPAAAAPSAALFDAYGTLFDVLSAVRQHAAELGTQADAVSALWRPTHARTFPDAQPLLPAERLPAAPAVTVTSLQELAASWE